MPGKYEDLDVYQRAFGLALEVHKFSQLLPDIEKYALASQIRRASMGICANIAECQAKSHLSRAEFKRFLAMAMGSAAEMRVWIKFCKELGYLPEKRWSEWDDSYEQVSRMLNGLWQKV